METFINAVEKFGFPIAVALFLLFRMDSAIRENRLILAELRTLLTYKGADQDPEDKEKNPCPVDQNPV